MAKHTPAPRTKRLDADCGCYVKIRGCLNPTKDEYIDGSLQSKCKCKEPCRMIVDFSRCESDSAEASESSSDGPATDSRTEAARDEAKEANNNRTRGAASRKVHRGETTRSPEQSHSQDFQRGTSRRADHARRPSNINPDAGHAASSSPRGRRGDVAHDPYQHSRYDENPDRPTSTARQGRSNFRDSDIFDGYATSSRTAGRQGVAPAYSDMTDTYNGTNPPRAPSVNNVLSPTPHQGNLPTSRLTTANLADHDSIVLQRENAYSRLPPPGGVTDVRRRPDSRSGVDRLVLRSQVNRANGSQRRGDSPHSQ